MAFETEKEWAEATSQAQGALLGVAALLDFSLSQLLATYYEIPDGKRLSFTGTIASKIGYRSKIDALRAILRANALVEGYRSLFASLETIGTWRNIVAHSESWLGPKALSEEEVAFVGSRRGEAMIFTASVMSLRAMAQRARRVDGELGDLHAVVGALPRSVPGEPSEWRQTLLNPDEDISDVGDSDD